MTRLLRIITAAAAVLLISSAAWAETINTIEAVRTTALKNNLDYKSAVLDVMKAENALEGIFRLEKSTLGISGSYGNGSTAAGEAGWQASANLPLFDQLSLGATINQDLKGTVSLNISPLTHSAAAGQSSLNYSMAVAAAEQKAADITENAIGTYLKWAAASADYDIKVRSAAVKRSLYEDERVRLDHGESDLDSVRDAFTSWSGARTAVNTALNSLQELETDLYAALNLDPGKSDLAPPDTDTISGLITGLEDSLDNSELGIDGSYAVLSAAAEIENYRMQLDNTWPFEPDLSLGGTMTVSPDAPVPTFSATASLSFSPADWKQNDRSELESQLGISREHGAQVRIAEELKINQLKTAAENAAINLGIAGIESEQADELFSEAGFLYRQGQYSEAELEETRLEMLQSQNSLFSATSERYLSLLSLSAYIQ